MFRSSGLKILTGILMLEGLILSTHIAEAQNLPSSSTSRLSAPALNARLYHRRRTPPNSPSEGSNNWVPNSNVIPPGVIACPGFENTKVINAAIPAPGVATRFFTNRSGTFGPGGTSTQLGFGANEAIVLRFVMPVDENSIKISMSETGSGATGQATVRTIVLSDLPCDFSVPSTRNLYSNGISMQFSLNLDSSPSSSYGKYELQGGTTYYLNVSNIRNGTTSCSEPICDVFITFGNPN